MSTVNLAVRWRCLSFDSAGCFMASFEMSFEERLGFGGGDFGDPAGENGLLRRFGVSETDAHAHARKNEDDLCVGFEDARVTGNLDDDVRSVRKWIGEIEIAAANAEVGEARLELGTGSDFYDPCFGGQGVARVSTAFAATSGWRLLSARLV